MSSPGSSVESELCYCVPSGTQNSLCSAGLEHFQLGRPAERCILAPRQLESFSVEMLEVFEEFSFLRGCHPGSWHTRRQRQEAKGTGHIGLCLPGTRI